MQRRVVVIIAVVAVAAAVALVLTVPSFPRSQPFNLSRSLPTGTAYSNGQFGCGPTVTVRGNFPANGQVSYWITQHESGASVNINITSDSGGGYTFLNTGSGGHEHGNFPSGDGRFTFVFQACGPTPTVPLGFWGVTNYSAPFL